MSEDLTYCVRGCTRTNANQEREPKFADVGLLCHSCLNRLEKWLTEIPERFALLPEFLTPTTDLESNPEAANPKRTNSPAPLRVAALDLLDDRLGRRWQATEPTQDRRGAIGTLLAIANEIRTSRGSARLTNSHVLTEADYIRHALDLLAHSPGIAEIHDELRILHRELGDAVGIYPPKPVGTCQIPDDNDAPCGGPLLPNAGGVSCPRCDNHWDHNTLRFLGRTLEEAETA